MMKRAAQSALVILLQIFLAASTGMAGVDKEKLSVTPFIGGYTFDGSQSLKTKPVYGIRAGYALNDRWDIEGVLDYVSTKPKSGSGDADAYNYRVEGIYKISPVERFLPFLAAGAGGSTVNYPDSTGEGSVTLPVLAYGGGLKYFLSESWALRGDIRHLLVIHKTDRVLSNLEYAIGASITSLAARRPLPRRLTLTATASSTTRTNALTLREA